MGQAVETLGVPLLAALALLWGASAALPRPRWAIVAAVLFATAAALYSSTISYGFLSDDYELVGLVGGDSTGALFRSFFGDWNPQGAQYYRPLVRASLAVDHLLWGMRPEGYHATNVLITTAGALVLVPLLEALGAGRPAALLGALAWIAHPMSASATAWVSQRTDSVMAVFYLAALLAVMRNRPVLAAVAAALALMSKEMAVTLPATAFVLVAFALPPEGLLRRRWLLVILAAEVALYLAAWYLLFTGGRVAAAVEASGQHVAWLLAVLSAPVFLPTTYGHWWRTNFSQSYAYLLAALIVLPALVWGLCRIRRREGARIVLAGWVWPFVAAAPLLGLAVPDAYRLGLLPAVGAALLAAGLAETLSQGPRVLMACTLAVALAPLAAEASAAWGPWGFYNRMVTRWKLRDQRWQSRLTPEMRDLFLRTAAPQVPQRTPRRDRVRQEEPR